MTRPFFRLKLATLDQTLAINASHIRAVLPLKDGKYQVWFVSNLVIPPELGKRIAKLGGVTPVSKDCWEVESSDLAELFKVAP